MKRLIWVMLLFFGLVGTAFADCVCHKNFNFRVTSTGQYTNDDAWSAKIIERGGDDLWVVRYGERVRLHLMVGEMYWFRTEDRVRVVPFDRDGEFEYGEIRLPSEDFATFGVVRYLWRGVLDCRPEYYYPTYRPHVTFDLHIVTVRPPVRRSPIFIPPHRDSLFPPAPYRRTEPPKQPSIREPFYPGGWHKQPDKPKPPVITPQRPKEKSPAHPQIKSPTRSKGGGWEPIPRTSIKSGKR